MAWYTVELAEMQASSALPQHRTDGGLYRFIGWGRMRKDLVDHSFKEAATPLRRHVPSGVADQAELIVRNSHRHHAPIQLIGIGE